MAREAETSTISKGEESRELFCAVAAGRVRLRLTALFTAPASIVGGAQRRCG